MEPVDRLNRPLRALRVSVTDRCNFRCPYCMPRERFGDDHAFLDRQAILSFEEIERLVRLFVALGVRKVRLTGGEPLLRRDLPELVRRLRAIPELRDIALTTNGALLPELARPLRVAGLDRVTVSLDALDPDRFAALSDSRLPVGRVLEGIATAGAAGFGPLKLNCVLQRGVNEDEILPLAAFARAHGHLLRFIEYMDVGSGQDWRMDRVVPAEEVARRLSEHWPLERVDSGHADCVAQHWRYRDGGGEVGLIASVTAPFCQGCDRARLSADGHLYACLFATEGLDLKGLLRGGATDATLSALLRSRWARREDRYSELRTEATARQPKVEMFRLGG